MQEMLARLRAVYGSDMRYGGESARFASVSHTMAPKTERFPETTAQVLRELGILHVEHTPALSAPSSSCVGLAQQAVLERERGQKFVPMLRDQNLLLELHPLAAAGGADIAFDADHHIGLEGTVIAMRCEISDAWDQRIFIAHSGAMNDAYVAVFEELFGKG